VIDGQVGLVCRFNGLAEEGKGKVDVGELSDALERRCSCFSCACVWIT
jgi:hypothetical protein